MLTSRGGRDNQRYHNKNMRNHANSKDYWYGTKREVETDECQVSRRRIASNGQRQLRSRTAGKRDLARPRLRMCDRRLAEVRLLSPLVLYSTS